MSARLSITTMSPTSRHGRPDNSFTDCDASQNKFKKCIVSVAPFNMLKYSGPLREISKFRVKLGDSVFLAISTHRSPEGAFPYKRVPMSAWGLNASLVKKLYSFGVFIEDK